tara:strand:+ start:400 stop:534 length:135 start_codon:yes stop_codon:yes gene_type:complete
MKVRFRGVDILAKTYERVNANDDDVKDILLALKSNKSKKAKSNK